jgi:hypothetical protein
LPALRFQGGPVPSAAFLPAPFRNAADSGRQPADPPEQHQPHHPGEAERRGHDAVGQRRSRGSAPLTELEKVIALAQDVAVIRAELGVMKWMRGMTIGGVLALLVKSIFG